MATIYPKDDFDAEAAAGEIKDAMDGMGTNESQIIKVLVTHSTEQRMEIAKYYKTAYGQDMMEDLKGELGGELEQTVIAMLAPPRVYDAREMHRALSGGGTDESCLIEILVSRNNEEIAEIREKYTEEFERDLEKDIDEDTGGNFQRLLVSLVNGCREETDYPDDDMAMQDAQDIVDAGEGQCGTDESKFNKVLCLRSRLQLYAMFDKYAEVSSKSIEDVIDGEVSGTLHEGYMSIVKHARNPEAYFAWRLKNAMAGGGTNDDTLIRIVVSRSEVNLADIADSYNNEYGKPLADAIADDCGGDYKKLLVAIVQGDV